MKFKIIEEKNNPLFKRKELVLALDYEGGATPSKESLRELISKEFDAEKEKIEVSKILSTIGKSVGKAWLKIWEEKVPEKKIKKGKLEQPPEKKTEEGK